MIWYFCWTIMCIFWKFDEREYFQNVGFASSSRNSLSVSTTDLEIPKSFQYVRHDVDKMKLSLRIKCNCCDIVGWTITKSSSPKLWVEKSHLRGSFHFLPSRRPAHILRHQIFVLLCLLLHIIVWNLKDAKCCQKTNDDSHSGPCKHINGVVTVIGDPGEGGKGGEEEGEELEPGTKEERLTGGNSFAHIHLWSWWWWWWLGRWRYHDKSCSETWKLSVAGGEGLHGVVQLPLLHLWSVQQNV